MKRIALLVLSCFSLFFGSIFAQSHQWTGNGGDTNWFNASNWDAGTVPDATSTVAINGNFDVHIQAGPATVQSLELSSGARLILEQDLESNSMIINNSGAILEFISGTLSGAGIENDGLFKLTGNTNKVLNEIIINNQDEIHVFQSNQTQVLGTTINNAASGLIDIASVGGFLQQSTNSVLNNSGILKKSNDGINSVGNFYLILEINNHGVIQVPEDETFLLLAGNSNFINSELGTVRGSGTYDITANFINSGTVVPGGDAEVGTMNITNNFSLNGGWIELDIFGNDPAQFDRITVTGSPDLSGYLNLNLTFIPELGDEFQVITGSQGLTNCDFPDFASAVYQGIEYGFEIICNTNDVTLRLDSIEILEIGNFEMTDAEFFVHPNPVNREAVFSFPSEWGSSENNSLAIYNYLGQEVLKIEGISSKVSKFRRGNLPGGLYFVILKSNGKVLATTRMVIE